MSTPTTTARTGRYVRQPGGFRAFYPSELPFAPPVRYDAELQYILSRADQAIGRLDSLLLGLILVNGTHSRLLEEFGSVKSTG